MAIFNIASLVVLAATSIAVSDAARVSKRGLAEVILRSYASPECVAFPQITQITACCTFGTHHVPAMREFRVVAADVKRVAFQQLQGYITTLNITSRTTEGRLFVIRKEDPNPYRQV
jgi:hypothetical protein